MTEPELLQRLRIVYGKGEAIRYIGNQDLVRFWERAIRRADLPLAYSHGFNPQPRLSNAHALPLGSAGEREVLDIWLATPVPPDEVAARLRQAMPPAVQIHEVAEAPLKAPALQATVTEADYRLRVCTDLPDAELQQRVERIMAATTLPRARQRKKDASPTKYDLRPLIYALRYVGREGEWAEFFAHLRAAESATGRPDEVLAELGLADAPCRITRLRLYFRDAVEPVAISSPDR